MTILKLSANETSFWKIMKFCGGNNVAMEICMCEKKLNISPSEAVF